MPYHLVPKGTEILVNDENWYLVDYDIVSVQGIIFMSFTEGKYNELRDDLSQQLANADQLNEWKIDVAAEIYAAQGDILSPVFSLCKNGINQEVSDMTYIVGPGLRQDDDGSIVVEASSGDTGILIQYKDLAQSYQTIHIGEKKESYAIVGDDTIRVTYSATYTFKQANSETTDFDIHFELDDTSLATITSQTGFSCVVTANELNKVGTITLYTDYAGSRHEKQIKIISLWQQGA